MQNFLNALEYIKNNEPNQVLSGQLTYSKGLITLSRIFLFIFLIAPSVSLAQFGYKDLKPGMTAEELKPLCGYEFTQWNWTECENYSKTPYPMVFLYTSSPESLEVHTIAVAVGTYDAVFQSLFDSMSKKYNIDYQFSDLDFKRYNNEQKERLVISFEEGQVLLIITRLSNGHNVFVSYSTKEQGKTNLDKNRPNSLNTNDF